MNFKNKDDREMFGLSTAAISISIVSFTDILHNHADYAVFYCIGLFVGAWIAETVYNKKE